MPDELAAERSESRAFLWIYRKLVRKPLAVGPPIKVRDEELQVMSRRRSVLVNEH